MRAIRNGKGTLMTSNPENEEQSNAIESDPDSPETSKEEEDISTEDNLTEYSVTEQTQGDKVDDQSALSTSQIADQNLPKHDKNTLQTEPNQVSEEEKKSEPDNLSSTEYEISHNTSLNPEEDDQITGDDHNLSHNEHLKNNNSDFNQENDVEELSPIDSENETASIDSLPEEDNNFTQKNPQKEEVNQLEPHAQESDLKSDLAQESDDLNADETPRPDWEENNSAVDDQSEEEKNVLSSTPDQQSEIQEAVEEMHDASQNPETIITENAETERDAETEPIEEEADFGLLQAIELTKTYGETIALNHVNFTTSSKSLGILGPNGSGKSTFLKLLLNLINPTKGDIQLNPGIKDIRVIQDYPRLPEELTIDEWMVLLEKIPRKINPGCRCSTTVEFAGSLEN